MSNIPQEVIDKIQDLVKSDNLIKALNIIENYNVDFNQIVFMKGQVNMLKQHKGLWSTTAYNVQLQKLKKSICGIVGLEYQQEEISLDNSMKTINRNEFIEKENRIRSRIIRLENRIQDPHVKLLRRRFERLVKEKKNMPFAREELNRFFTQIEFSLEDLASSFSIDFEDGNQIQGMNSKNKQPTLGEELEILISQNQSNNMKLNKLLILQTKYLDLENSKKAGTTNFENYFLNMNRIDHELEYKVKNM